MRASQAQGHPQFSVGPAEASSSSDMPHEQPALRLLVITSRLPFPPNWGSGRRVFHLVKDLAQRNEVTVLCFAGPEDGPESRAAFSVLIDELVVVPSPIPSEFAKRLRQVLSVLSPTPFLVRSVRQPRMQRALDELLVRKNYDAVLIESSQMGWLNLPDRARVVVDEHNIESEVLTRSSQTETSPARRLFSSWEARRYSRHERRVWRRSSACSAPSERDARAIESAVPDLAVAVVPNGVDCREFCPDSTAVKRNSIVFVGLLRYRPNIDGLRWFLSEVFPLVRTANPDATLTVVGDGPDELLESLRQPGVQVTGWVTDVRPHMREASVVVVPIRFGGGTRLKVVEAMAMAKAVVSTSLGAEGIDAESGTHLMLADEPSAFADTVVALLADDETRDRLGSEARVLAEARYSWEQAASTLEALVRVS